MNSSYGPCTVVLNDSVFPNGETIDKAKITTLGEPPNMMVKLYQWERGQFGVHRFVEIDQMTNCTVQNTADGFIITGVSQQMVNEIGLDAADSLTTWIVDIKGCPTC